MNTNFDSLFPISGDHEVPSKRRKLNIIKASNTKDSFKKQRNGETRKLPELHPRILQAEVTAAQFHKMRVQIEEIMKEEERSLNIRIQENTETIKHLEVIQERTMWTKKDDFEVQASAKAEISQIKKRMREKFTRLLTVQPKTNPSRPDDISSFPKTQKDETQAENELKPSEKPIYPKLAHMLEEKWISQEYNYDDLEKSSTEIQRLHSERVVHSNQLEEEPSPAKDVILTLCGTPIGNLVLGDQIISIEKELDDVDKVEQMVFLPDKPDELSSSLQGYESNDSRNWSVAGKYEGVRVVSMHENVSPEETDPLGDLSPGSYNPTNNYNSSQEVSDSSNSSPYLRSNSYEYRRDVEISRDLRIGVGNYYVLASHPHFFDIDWNMHYTRHPGRQYVCNMCPAVRDGIVKIQDHIWARHYGGTFNCPFCPDLRSSLTRHIGAHMRKYHFLSSASTK